MRVTEVPYACPVCSGPLTAAEASFACSACRAPYPVEATGIPNFLALPDAYRQTHEDWERVIARFVPWRDQYLRRKRLRQFFDSLQFWRTKDPKQYDYDRYVQRRMVELVGVTGTVLEVGCGPGSLYPLASWERYVGVDPVVYFSGHPPFQFCRAYGEFLPFPDRTFDAIYMAASFDYLFAPDTALRGFRRILKPGGVFSLALGLSRQNVPATLQLRRYNLEGLLAAVRPHFRVEAKVEDLGYAYLTGTAE